MVVPKRYSAVSPLLLPLNTDLAICGSQKHEYIMTTKANASEGDKMTRTIRLSMMNSVSPIRENDV